MRLNTYNLKTIERVLDRELLEQEKVYLDEGSIYLLAGHDVKQAIEVRALRILLIGELDSIDINSHTYFTNDYLLSDIGRMTHYLYFKLTDEGVLTTAIGAKDKVEQRLKEQINKYETKLLSSVKLLADLRKHQSETTDERDREEQGNLIECTESFTTTMVDELALYYERLAYYQEVYGKSEVSSESVSIRIDSCN